VRRHRVLLTALAGALLGAPASPASADELWPTRQHVAANAEFLPFSEPPAEPASICLVDTGVDLHPDLEGVIAHREALDGGTPNDVSSDKHGTTMALVAAAKAGNGIGMVGAAGNGSVRIVSIRASDAAGVVSEAAMGAGIERCVERGRLDRIAVVLLPLASSEDAPNVDATREEVAERIRDAAAAGLLVVAAGGNDGGDVRFPAGSESVWAVGGVDAAGDLCAFSARGPQIDALLQACPLDVASDGSPALLEGTSFAAGMFAGFAAAMRASQPTASPTAIAQALAHDGGSGRPVDLEAAFARVGIPVRRSASGPDPTAHASVGTAPPTSAESRVPSRDVPPVLGMTRPQARPSLARPRVAVHRRGDIVRLRILNRLPGVTVDLRVGRFDEGVRRLTAQRSSFRLRLHGRRVLSVRFRSPRHSVGPARIVRLKA
jgi:hypothetical protein